MPCSQEQALVLLFYYVSISSFLLLLLSYFISIFLHKLFFFIGSPIFPRDQYEYDQYGLYSDDEEEEERDDQHDHLVADIVCGGEALSFLPNENHAVRNQSVSEEFIDFDQELENLGEEDENHSSFIKSVFESPVQGSSEAGHYNYDVEFPTKQTDHSVHRSDPDQVRPSSITMSLQKNDWQDFNIETRDGCYKNQESETKEERLNLTGDEKFYVYAPTETERRKLKVEEKEEEDEEIFGESCTVGSTSKSSSEWRSSINHRDSGTDDPFSSSSRRSCPKWESYTVFQKYGEEMMFLDRISAEKLHETESLRSIEACPRSISERIVLKFANINKKPAEKRHRNSYHALEAAYVAQICLTWEALNCNYKNFESKRASMRDFDPGCPGKVAQQFQQFQVLLHRYIENEPYEHGRRPEIYARMRLLAPKLLQVPEYQDLEDDQKDDGFVSKISSPSFLMIMEDGIRTFMSFLKADREKPCQILASFFKRKKRGDIDPSLLQLVKNANQKKKLRLKDLRRTRKCLRKRRRLKVEEEMEIVMALIDLEVVSRVLRMVDISEEQLRWCEQKMSKVKILDGKLHRDSSPLFFPVH